MTDAGGGDAVGGEGTPRKAGFNEHVSVMS